MHELSVTESILNIASRHAEQAEARVVTDIHIVVGKLSSIVDDSVQFYWDLISEGTICAGAKLHFQRVPARLACQDCGTEFQLEAELIPCPHCGSVHIKVLTGEEFWLDSIEITR
ncbi:MAG TPA: hydrogenase maturation nickel metallochaperone HypA [Anaerolineaceae bacterium]|jgi:hydrogenase nickel incorporation protein HypA/HybF|nr:hydrogenase maturation nickel metallochaperone HypA [Anaerolineaceae bacterium]